MQYILQVPNGMSTDIENAWVNTNIYFENISAGCGTAEYTFLSPAARYYARLVAVDTMQSAIKDIDMEDDPYPPTPIRPENDEDWGFK